MLGRTVVGLGRGPGRDEREGEREHIEEDTHELGVGVGEGRVPDLLAHAERQVAVAQILVWTAQDRRLHPDAALIPALADKAHHPADDQRDAVEHVGLDQRPLLLQHLAVAGAVEARESRQLVVAVEQRLDLLACHRDLAPRDRVLPGREQSAFLAVGELAQHAQPEATLLILALILACEASADGASEPALKLSEAEAAEVELLVELALGWALEALVVVLLLVPVLLLLLLLFLAPHQVQAGEAVQQRHQVQQLAAVRLLRLRRLGGALIVEDEQRRTGVAPPVAHLRRGRG